MIDPATTIFFYPLVFVIGLCFGSFATALIYRIPRDIPWVYDRGAGSNKACRSACPSCGHVLGARDLVPLFSWLCSRGKCRYCSAKVSARYPLVELATASTTLLMFGAWGVGGLATIPVLLIVPFLIAALLIDWEHMILPDDINLSLFVLAAAYVLARFYTPYHDISVVYDAVFAAVLLTSLLWLASFILSKWKGRPALGMGDIKFLPAAGLLLGTAALPSYLALSGALGIATAMLKLKKDIKQPFPFGPALIISLYIHVFLTGMGFDYKW